MATQAELERLFEERGINFDEPGFYDVPTFQEAEGDDRRFLENYAEYLHVRAFSEDYLNRARTVITDMSAYLSEELQTDGRLGACIDASGALMRMLEREGIWGVMVGGATIVEFPPASGLNPRYFWPLVHPNNPAKTGHMWLYAPPFKVVDTTLSIQNWDERQSRYIPRVVLAEVGQPEQANIGDLMESDLIVLARRQLGRMPGMQDLAPAHLATMTKFPAFSVLVGETRIKYVPAHVSAMDAGLDRMRNLRLNGRYPAEIYEHYLEGRRDRLARPEGHAQ